MKLSKTYYPNMKMTKEQRRLLALKAVRDIFEINPRISLTKLHGILKKKVGIKMRNTTIRYINDGYKKEIIRPPRPIFRYHKNFHQHITFIEGNVLDLDSLVEEKEGIRYACALSGNSEIIMITSFTCSGDDLYFLGYTKGDGFDKTEKFCLKSLEFSRNDEPMQMNVPAPELNWDSTDWKLFHALSPDMRIPYTKISRNEEINLKWRAIKSRLEEKVFPACEIAAYFFPKGQKNYQQVFFRFKTQYQKNFYEKLNNFQSTSYFLYFGKDEIGIFAFPENMNEILKIFKKMEMEGIIDDLQHFLPVEWYHCDLGRPWASSTSPST